MKIITHRLSEEQLAAARAIAPDADFVAPTTDEELQREIEDADAIFGGVTPELIRPRPKTSLDPNRRCWCRRTQIS